jgi:hypothetical protein
MNRYEVWLQTLLSRPVPDPQQREPEGSEPAPRPGAAGATGFTSAERFWYLLGNIALGATYLRKIPATTALSDFGLARLNDTAGAWCTILCIATHPAEPVHLWGAVRKDRTPP